MAGLAGVACSAMLYLVTRRPSWRASVTWPRFALGSLVGGAAVAVATGAGRPAAILLACSLAAKLAWEAAAVWHPGPVPAAGLARYLLGLSAIVLALDGAPLALLAVLAGELIERSRFFTAASWTGMPSSRA